MLDNLDSIDLVEKAAALHGVPPQVLRNLLELETQFPNFAAPGAKGEFARRVAAIIGQAAGDVTDD